MTDEPMVALTHDPYWETADTDVSNNSWPRKAMPSRLELYKTQHDKDNLMKEFNEKLKTKDDKADAEKTVTPKSE
jgi:hypothetical protein